MENQLHNIGQYQQVRIGATVYATVKVMRDGQSAWLLAGRRGGQYIGHEIPGGEISITRLKDPSNAPCPRFYGMEMREIDGALTVIRNPGGHAYMEAQ